MEINIIETIGWTFIIIIGFISVFIVMGLISIELIEYAKQLINIGKEIRKKINGMIRNENKRRKR